MGLFSLTKFVIAAVVVTSMFASADNAAAQSAAVAAKEFKRLTTLRTLLKKIPMERQDREPHRSFLKRNTNDIVYSEPSGEWYVRSARFWDLRERNASLPIADDIAWAAADNPLPGECEGYVNCYMYQIRATYGEYLRLYPSGKHAAKAVKKLIEYQVAMAADAELANPNFEGPTDDGERAEFRKLVGEMQSIIEKITDPRKRTVLAQLEGIERVYSK